MEKKVFKSFRSCIIKIGRNFFNCEFENLTKLTNFSEIEKSLRKRANFNEL